MMKKRYYKNNNGVICKPVVESISKCFRSFPETMAYSICALTPESLEAASTDTRSLEPVGVSSATVAVYRGLVNMGGLSLTSSTRMLT